MELFQGKKVKLETIKDEGNYQYFIDYFKLKKKEDFMLNFIQDFTQNNNSLLVIDSNNFYTRNYIDAENKIIELKKELDKHEISYEEVITKKEVDKKVFGIKIQNSKKVNSYKIGFAVTPDQFRNAAEIVKNYNVFYFAAIDNMNTEDLRKQFLNVCGNYDELNELSEFNLYNDCYFRRTRICSKIDMIQSIEKRLQN